MSLFSFIKDAGEKLFKKPAPAATADASSQNGVEQRKLGIPKLG